MRQSLLILVVLLLGLAVAPAQDKSKIDPRFDRTNHADEWGWTKAAWANRDAKFEEMRADIESFVKTLPASSKIDRIRRLASERRAQFEKSSSSETLFTWAYTAYAAASIDPAFGYDRKNLAPMLQFEKFSQDDSYEFARIRFLMTGFDFPSIQLIPIAERLLAKKPNDVHVKFRLLGLYQPSRSSREEARARALAEELKRSKPNDYRYCSAVGSVYYLCYRKGHQADDARRAMAEYEQYLKLAPATSGFRPKAETLLKELKKALSL